MLTREQLAARRKHVGGSDIAAILGISPWKTKAEVYYDKVLDVEADKATAAMDLGNWFESPLIDFACERLGVTCERNVTRISDGSDGGILAAQIDAIVNGKPHGMEAKYTGMADGWGEDGTDAVPEMYLAQAQVEMYVHKLDVIHFPVFYAASFRPERRLYTVPRNEEIIGIIVAEAVRFWNEHVIPRIPPADEPPPMDMLRRLIRIPASTITLDDTALTAWEERESAAETKKQAEKSYERATAKCLMILGSNEVGTLADGRLLTYNEENAGDKLIDSDQAKAMYPELFHPTTRRVLRLRKAPKGKK